LCWGCACAEGLGCIACAGTLRRQWDKAMCLWIAL
jgi:hypothetical protein